MDLTDSKYGETPLSLAAENVGFCLKIKSFWILCLDSGMDLLQFIVTFRIKTGGAQLAWTCEELAGQETWPTLPRYATLDLSGLCVVITSNFQYSYENYQKELLEKTSSF